MDTRLSIKLPLPLDIVQTLNQMIGSAYPSAKIDARAKKDSSDREMVYWISDEDRSQSLENEIPVVVAVPSAGDIESILSGVSDGSLGFTPPEYFINLLGGLVEQILSDGDIENYLEMAVRIKDKDYAIVACRSPEQTPHALRSAAEVKLLEEKARSRAYATKLRELGVDPSSLV